MQQKQGFSDIVFSDSSQSAATVPSPEPEWTRFLSDGERHALRIAGLRETALANLGLPSQVVNCLEDSGSFTIGEFADLTRRELLELPNIGENTLEECAQKLDRQGVPHCDWSAPRQVRRRRKKS